MSKKVRLAGIATAIMLATSAALTLNTSSAVAHTAESNSPQVVSQSNVAVKDLWVTVTEWPSPDGSLSGMAKHYYGNASKWKVIYDANRARISNPNIIRTGLKVLVPNINAKVIAAPKPKVKSNPVVVSKAKWVLPVTGYSLTSCYGMRWGALHRGLDMAKGYGSAIKSVSAGTVVKAGWVWHGYGIEVVVQHGKGVYTHYAHMRNEIVKVGQRVKANQVIGYIGMTGDTTGPHLHFEVMKTANYGSQINPAPWLRAHGIKIGC